MNILIPDGTDPNNPVRIYTDGVFDCFHYGHAKLLEQCKRMFSHVYLIVGVTSDEETWKNKCKTIMYYKERYECIKHCRWADEVVEGPWVCTIEFLNNIGAHYIAHDPEPYPMGKIADLYGPFKEAGRFLPTKRTEGVSTTDLIVRILKDYNIYLERQVSRGITAEELNITPSKYLAIKLAIIFKKEREKALDLLK